MDEYCGDESEEKNPYPANDYIGNAQTRCLYFVYGEMITVYEWIVANENLYLANNYT